MFKDDLCEMDDSRAVVQNLVDEYLEATKDTYLQWQPVCTSNKNLYSFNTIIVLFTIIFRYDTIQQSLRKLKLYTK